MIAGAVLLGFAGNIAENLSAITLSSKGKFDVASIAVNSSIQIGIFVAPLLGLLSVFIGKPMTLSFLPIEIVAIFLSVLLANEIGRDEKATYLEGIQLIALYVVLAILFYFS